MQDLEIAVSTTNKELESLNKDLLRKINQLENEVNRHRNCQEVKEENSTLNLQKSELTQQLQQIHQDHQQLKEDNAVLVSEKNGLETLSTEMRQNLETLETQLKAFSDYHDIKSLNESLSSQLQNLQTELQVVREITHNEEAKDAEILSLKGSIGEFLTKLEVLNTDKTRLEKEIESSRSIIKDLNIDFEDHQKEIETLKKEKALIVAELESQSLKVTSELELNAAKLTNGKSSDKLDTLMNENLKLQDVNRELLEKLENLEKSSERKVSNMTQEIEDLLENSKHYIRINTEFNELKNKYDQLLTVNVELADSTDFGELNSVKSERDELSSKLNKIMNEVEDVSNKNLFLEQKVENYLILEQSNERLRSTNEKLSRQLDETLVSLIINKLKSDNDVKFFRFPCIIMKESKRTPNLNISKTFCFR